MPCMYHDEAPSDAKESRDRAIKEATYLTKLLCSAGRKMLRGEMPPQEVIDWWQHHATLDAIKGEPW